MAWGVLTDARRSDVLDVLVLNLPYTYKHTYIYIYTYIYTYIHTYTAALVKPWSSECPVHYPVLLAICCRVKQQCSELTGELSPKLL